MFNGIKIFLSYSHHNKKEADKIDYYLSALGIQLIRDIRDFKPYYNLIKSMKIIQTCDYIIMLISDNFMKSKYCMFEMIELIKIKNCKNRIIPISLQENNNPQIGPKFLIKYHKYWKWKLCVTLFFSKASLLRTIINALSFLTGISIGAWIFYTIPRSKKYFGLRNFLEDKNGIETIKKHFLMNFYLL